VVAKLDTLGVSHALIITAGANDMLERAARNLPTIKVLRAEGANVYDILPAPLITEKVTLVNAEGNHVVFRVRRDANKDEIRRAIETLFKVKVEKVRTLNLLGKTRRVGRHVGRRPAWKKAYVTLAEGQRIDFFENV
jgi:large subunit ribosomal protein L23